MSPNKCLCLVPVCFFSGIEHELSLPLSSSHSDMAQFRLRTISMGATLRALRSQTGSARPLLHCHDLLLRHRDGQRFPDGLHYPLLYGVLRCSAYNLYWWCFCGYMESCATWECHCWLCVGCCWWPGELRICFLLTSLDEIVTYDGFKVFGPIVGGWIMVSGFSWRWTEYVSIPNIIGTILC